MNDQFLTNQGYAISANTNGIGRFVGEIVQGVVKFANAVAATHGAAYRVEHLAERYYTMNRSELARLGLTRDRIPAELSRVLCG